VDWLIHVFDPANIGAFFTQFQADMQKPTFWLAVGKIIWINILLSGDNALVIAMACRGLHGRHRMWGMIIGSGVAVVLLIAFTGIVATLMTLPYLKLIGGIALLVIAAKLLVPEDENDEVAAGTTLWHAVRIVVIADIIMSLDNVLGMAGAAKGHYAMLFLGLLITMPLILFGSAMLMKLMERFPVFITIGAALIGYVAGDMIVSDLAIKDYVEAHLAFLDTYYVAGIAGALIVVGVGKLLGRKREMEAAAHAPESADPKQAQVS
jgi:YjbE family integral membrane protein